MNKHLRSLFWFSFAGLVGFLVDVIVLYLLKSLLGLYVSRVFSFFSAVVATWLINRKVTFKDNSSGHSNRNELLIYLLLMLFGGIANYTTYALLISKYGWATNYPITGVAAGSLAGMLINFVTSKTLLFRFTAPHKNGSAP